MLENTDNKFFTIDEYKEQIKTTQEDKDKKLVILYSSSPDKQDSFITSAKNRAYDVLKMDGQLDSHFINHLEQKVEGISLKRVDANTIDKLIDKDEKVESILSEEESTSLKELFEKTINDKNNTVTVETLPSDELPVIVTMPEFMRRMKDMAKTGGGGGMFMMGGDMPDQYNVAINSNHPLIAKILKAEKEEEKEQLAKQAYDLALLSQNLLTGAKLTSFIKRSVALTSE